MAIELVPLCAMRLTAKPPIEIGAGPAGIRMIFEETSVEVHGDRLRGQLEGVKLVRSSSLKERAGVNGVSACSFAGGIAFLGIAAWPYGWLSLIGARFVRAGQRVRDRAEPGRAAAPQASLMRWLASR